jgi:hypothetical protein
MNVGTLIAKVVSNNKQSWGPERRLQQAAGTSLLWERFFKAWTKKSIAPTNPAWQSRLGFLSD